MTARRGAIAAFLTFTILAGPVVAQDVSGTAYEDRDADGIRGRRAGHHDPHGHVKLRRAQRISGFAK